MKQVLDIYDQIIRPLAPRDVHEMTDKERLEAQKNFSERLIALICGLLIGQDHTQKQLQEIVSFIKKKK